MIWLLTYSISGRFGNWHAFSITFRY